MKSVECTMYLSLSISHFQNETDLEMTHGKVFLKLDDIGKNVCALKSKMKKHKHIHTDGTRFGHRLCYTVHTHIDISKLL